MIPNLYLHPAAAADCNPDGESSYAKHSDGGCLESSAARKYGAAPGFCTFTSWKVVLLAVGKMAPKGEPSSRAAAASLCEPASANEGVPGVQTGEEERTRARPHIKRTRQRTSAQLTSDPICLRFQDSFHNPIKDFGFSHFNESSTLPRHQLLRRALRPSLYCRLGKPQHVRIPDP